MPNSSHAIMTAAMAALLLAGCSMLQFGDDQRASAPALLAAAPTGSVTAAPLAPPAGMGPAPAASGLAALDPSVQAGTQPAAPGTAQVGRTDLLGGWTISSAGDSCQLFMTLTTWAGGYRASTRGCTSPSLKTISAWNMEGAQVQLLDDAGTTLARLYPASKSQFNGQTQGGGPISVMR